MILTRWMVCRDMPVVLAIESKSFSHPWTEADFIHALRMRNCIGMVAERDGEVVGYMVYEFYSDRIHLLNFAVAGDFRRSGVGSAMVERLKNKLHVDARKSLVLEVREGNVAAQLFFKRLGFRAVAILRDYYETGESAYTMRYMHRVECEV